MEPSELAAVRLRMRRKYELARARRALVVLIPVLALGSLAWRVGGDTHGPVLGGTLLAVVAVAFLWQGRGVGRIVLPAMFAGVLPFTCALFAHCAGESRFGICALACFGGSVLAGLVVARLARRSNARAMTWACAGAVAILTGSLACACVGSGGIVGLVIGIAAVALPSLLIPVRASN